MKLISFIQEEIDGAMRDFKVDRDEPSNYIQAFYKSKNERSNDGLFFDQQLLASVANLFVAGTDTTATTLRWAIFFMAYNPEFQEKVYQELINENSGRSLFDYADRTKLPYTEAVILETQRVANLLPVGLLRKTLVPTQLRGYDIPADTVVAPVLGAAMLDSNVYPNYETFDPNRFLGKTKDDPVFSHVIPFGLGKQATFSAIFEMVNLGFR
jgi:cytochrome P450